jgi:hypothetical protein
MKIALLLKRLGLTSTLLHSLGAASIAGSLSLWGRSAAVSTRTRRPGPSGSPSSWACGRRRSFFSAKSFRTSKRRQKSRLSRPACARLPSR